jgi:TIR domain/Leucine Rich repeats (2 copies)
LKRARNLFGLSRRQLDRVRLLTYPICLKSDWIEAAMAVADEAEGLAEAQRRIAACRETRSECLDLSDLGLTRVPEEVLELDWLLELNLKNEPWVSGSDGVGDEGARALSGLVRLTELDLSRNGLTDLSPLFHLVSLRDLNCSQCRLERTQPEFWDKPSLREVILYETELPGVPKEALSRDRFTSCLDTLRAHFRNIGERPSGRAVTARGNVSAIPKVEVTAPAPKGSAITEYYVSYAWGDATPEGQEREAIVERLCAQAQSRGRAVIRDKTAMRHGDRISKFMKRIAGGDRIFIILSDKYLKSAYCMGELFDVWRNCKQEPEEFIARTRVFVLPCAVISTPIERGRYAVYWREKLNEMDAFIKAHGQLVLSDDDNVDYRLMTRFVNETANILKLVKDILRPRSFNEFMTYGFDDPPR